MSIFFELPAERVLYPSNLFFIIEDGFPVSPGHLLIISNEQRADFFELTDEEKAAIPEMIQKAKELVLANYSPDGYNIGMNCGEAAGQTVMHFHCHIIPRYKGDMEDPRGGVRGVIPPKRIY
jgi:diadenosine tetraphosphate (Ap4A) HIT family hydrolase